MIDLIDIHKSFTSGAAAAAAVDGVTLRLAKGKILGIIGHSGAGKSTVLRCANLLTRPDYGTVRINGVDLTALDQAGLRRERRRIGMIFQHFNLLHSRTALQNVALPLHLAGLAQAHIDRRANALLDRVGLSQHRDKYPAQLSGGQRQRVGIARALATEPHVLLCDEATSALDPASTESVLALLRQINADFGLTTVLVTHEMHVVRALCDRVAVMSQGKVVEEGSVEDALLAPQHALTKEFLGDDHHTRVSPALAAEMNALPAFERAQRKVLRVSMRGHSATQPVLHALVTRHGLRVNLLAGSVAHIRATPFATMLLDLQGSAEHLKAGVAWLSHDLGAHTEVLL